VLSRLLPLLHASEGGSVEKVEGVWDLLQNEEKVESSTANVTSNLTTYPSTLLPFFSPPCHDKAPRLHALCMAHEIPEREIPNFGSEIL